MRLDRSFPWRTNEITVLAPLRKVHTPEIIL
jgi:hypothetical protein